MRFDARLMNRFEGKAFDGVLKGREPLIGSSFHGKFNDVEGRIHLAFCEIRTHQQAFRFGGRPSDASERHAGLVVEKTLCEVSINRVQFEAMEVASGLDVLRQPADVLKRTKTDLEDIARSGGFQIQPSPHHVRTFQAKPLTDFWLFQPMF